MTAIQRARLLGLLVIGALGAPGCAERATAGADPSTDAGATGSPPADAGRTTQGVYTCCGPGEGVTCCTADAGLLGYDVLPDGAVVAYGAHPGHDEANCFRYGGVSGACTARGDLLEGKDICALCCDGLVRVSTVSVGDGGACLYEAPPSLLTCLPCGNGVCDADENHCSCPADCP